ncbi:MAG: F0F1 ATP synthase subunit A [Ignavibacteria bacterium]|nr:F0F1 ATP synthase subunit A [Ignavibacteria bacterium]
MIDSTKIVADTLHNTESSSGSWIIEHIVDSNVLDFEPFGVIHLPTFQLNLFGITLHVEITKHVVFLWLAAFIVGSLLIYTARSYKKSFIPRGVANLVEMIIQFIKDEIVTPTIGEKYVPSFLPFLGTVFFFILTCNLLGLLPYGATATSNISVTASLALLSFIMIQFAGMKKNGVIGYFKGLIPHGVPVFLLPIMFVVEVLGLFTKPFALMIRLFANMTAGHVVILALIGLIFILKTPFISPVSILFALFIYLLELLVALIQAYIFTMLSSLFIGMAIHQEH